MFYQEILINNKLMYRTVPDGVWYECSNERLTKRLIEAEARIKELEGVVK